MDGGAQPRLCYCRVHGTVGPLNLHPQDPHQHQHHQQHQQPHLQQQRPSRNPLNEAVTLQISRQGVVPRAFSSMPAAPQHVPQQQSIIATAAPQPQRRRHIHQHARSFYHGQQQQRPLYPNYPHQHQQLQQQQSLHRSTAAKKATSSSNKVQFQSAPNSPSNHHQLGNKNSNNNNKHRYNAAVLAAVNQSHKAKKGPLFPSFSSNNLVESESDEPSISSEFSGCCEISIKRRGVRANSYSALDTLDDASDDLISEEEGVVAKEGKTPAKALGGAVKNLVQWVNKGTSAFVEALPSLKEPDHHLVMIGLDSAGKTTVLYRLKFDQYVNTVPTIGFNCEKVRGSMGKSRNLSLLVWDVGGQEKTRPLWRPYTRATDGVIFVVDSCDMDRVEEARLELHRIMRFTPDNVNVPLLVVANKQDLPGAASPSELETLLDLKELKQSWHLEAVCAVTGEGLDEGVEKLCDMIQKRKKKHAKRDRNKTR